MPEEQISVISPRAADAFSKRWSEATNERQDAQSFWREFFEDVCGITDIRKAGIEFEKPVISSLKGTTNWIDVYWKDTVLVEHKSAGKNLDSAEEQARNYLVSLPPKLRPPMIVVSDFQNFRIIDVLLNRKYEFQLENLAAKLEIIEVAFGLKEKKILEIEVEADQKAAGLMADLYQEFEDAGFKGHEVSVFLVRILFLLFGEDTRMFRTNLFKDFLADTADDGKDLGGRLQELFIALNTPKASRTVTSDVFIKEFPYVNGGIFEEVLPVFAFGQAMRNALIAASNYDWSTISPAIFGSMFQLIKTKELRRGLGEHFTSEKNIHRVIDPLFLDELNAQLVTSWDSRNKLRSLRLKLASYKFIDPACGCGNFLVVTYKALRQLELEIIRRLLELEGKTEDLSFDGTLGLSVSLSQFLGIEIEEWSSQIATVALFLADHQENIALEKITGDAPERFPLSKSPHIIHANALTTDWEKLTKVDENTFFFGNPPFIGSKERSPEQAALHDSVWQDVKSGGSLDFVACWFYLAAQMINKFDCRAAFVSTNSITQGRQPDVLWEGLNRNNVKIDFAYQSFRWSNESSGQAIVTCIIMGISSVTRPNVPRLWIRNSLEGTPLQVTQINPYLVEGPMVTTPSRKSKLSKQLSMANYGSIAYDEGHLVVDKEEAVALKNSDPKAAAFLARFIGGRELLYDEARYCLWLIDAKPGDLRSSKFIQDRLKLVAEFRGKSNRQATATLASTPWLFGEIRQPNSDFVAVAKVSSEKREYLPCAIFPKEVIASGSLLTISSANPLLDFALVCSRPMSVWNIAVSGRMKTDFQVSVEITYNNFPFPEISDTDVGEITALASEIMDARSAYPDQTIADLYDPLTMPKDLLQAHRNLDLKLQAILGLKKNASDSDILAALFLNYQNLVEGEQIKF
jgi:hypothetical protein